MNKLSTCSFVLSVSACGAAFLANGATQANVIVDGAGFRMVRDGQVYWEMKPEDRGGVRMTFFEDGKEIGKVVVGQKAAAVSLSAGSAQYEFVLTEQSFGESVVMKPLKATMARSIVADAKGNAKLHTHLEAGDNRWMVRAGDSVTTSVQSGHNEIFVDVGREDFELKSVAAADVQLDVTVGRDKRMLRCIGKVLAGFSVDMVNRAGSWTWTNK